MISKTFHTPSFLAGFLMTMIAYSALGLWGVFAIILCSIAGLGWGGWRRRYFMAKGMLRRAHPTINAWLGIAVLGIIMSGCSVGIDAGRNTRAIAEADNAARIRVEESNNAARVQVAREDAYARAAESEFRYLSRQSDAAARVEVAEIRSATRVAIFNNMSVMMMAITGMVVLGVMAILYMSTSSRRNEMAMMTSLLQQPAEYRQPRFIEPLIEPPRRVTQHYEDAPLMIVE